MTIQELYAQIDGNYEQAQRVMKMDKLIDRYVRKLNKSQVGEALAAAVEAMDGEKLFESAHAMKGVCSNLGLDALAAGAEVITEEFRPGTPRKLSDEAVKAKVGEVLALYRRTIEAIKRYEEG